MVPPSKSFLTTERDTRTWSGLSAVAHDKIGIYGVWSTHYTVVDEYICWTRLADQSSCSSQMTHTADNSAPSFRVYGVESHPMSVAQRMAHIPSTYDCIWCVLRTLSAYTYSSEQLRARTDDRESLRQFDKEGEFVFGLTYMNCLTVSRSPKCCS
jgi:hypothetical protein